MAISTDGGANALFLQVREWPEELRGFGGLPLERDNRVLLTNAGRWGFAMSPCLSINAFGRKLNR